jgi:hypothetical protein
VTAARVRLVLYVSTDATCRSALGPPVSGEGRCRRALTPPADNQTWFFLAGAECAVRRSVSRWSARRRSLSSNDLDTRRRTAIIAAPRKNQRTRSGAGISPTKQAPLINNWMCRRKLNTALPPGGERSGRAQVGSLATVSQASVRDRPDDPLHDEPSGHVSG